MQFFGLSYCSFLAVKLQFLVAVSAVFFGLQCCSSFRLSSCSFWVAMFVPAVGFMYQVFL